MSVIMLFSEHLEQALEPLRAEYRSVVNGWLADGTFAATYPAFLVESFHYVKHSCELMQLAASRLTDESRELQTYLLKHASEEAGHEKWILGDLEALGYSRGDVTLSVPLPETLNLIGSQWYVINHVHAAGLIGYVYVMESTPPTFEFLDYMNQALSIPKEAVTFLREHAELDIEHRRELIQILDTLFDATRLRTAAILSSQVGLKNVVELLDRIRCGDFLTSRARLWPVQRLNEGAHSDGAGKSSAVLADLDQTRSVGI